MKKKIICAILVTALAVTSFTGCGKAQDKDTAEVIMAETETKDPDITAETQAAVDTLLPTETGKPVVQLPHRHLVIIIMSRNIGRLHLLVTAVEIGLWSALSVGM